MHGNFHFQEDETDCGYACIATILSLYGRYTTVSELKSRFGKVSGISLLQIKQIFSALSLKADAYKLDDIEQIRRKPALALAKNKHFVLVLKIQRKFVKLFDPSIGIVLVDRQEFFRDYEDLILEVEAEGLDTKHSKKNWAVSIRELIRDIRISSFIVQILICVGFVQLFEIATPFLSKQLFDHALSGNSEISVLVVAFLICSLFKIISQHIRSLSLTRFQSWLDIHFSELLFKKIMGQSSQYFMERSPTNIDAKFEAISRYVGFFTIGLFGLVVDFPLILISLGIIFYFSEWLAVLTIVYALLTYLFKKYSIQKITPVSESVFQAEQRFQLFKQDTLDSAQTIKNYGKEKHFIAYFSILNQKVESIRLRKLKLIERESINESLLTFFDNFTFLLISLLFLINNEITVGTYLAIGMYKSSISVKLESMLSVLGEYKGLVIYKKSLNELFEQGTLSNKTCVVAKTPIGVAVKVNEVSFSYNQFQENVINNISCEFQKESITLIRGKSGSGKSTLCNLMAGNLIATSGEVLISEDGKHSKVVYVKQNEKVLPGTLRQNVTMLDESITDNKILKVCRSLGLQETIERLPMRLETPMSNTMQFISGGELQRLFLARALLLEPFFLILDESTNNIDSETQSQIIRGLRDKKITSVIVSHREEIVGLVDKVINI